MIIRFFKTSFFSRLLTLILLILALWLPEPAIFPNEVQSILPFNPWIQQLLALSVFFLTALFINEISTENRLSDRNSYLTAFFFILVGSGTGFLTQPNLFLLSAFFFVLFYRKVFAFQNSTKIITTAFDAGLFLGIASLFYPPALFLLLFVWIAMLIYQVDRWRAYVTIVLGLLLPWFFVFSGYFWFNRLPEALSGFLQYFHFREIGNPFSDNTDLIMFLLVALLTFAGVLSILGRLSSFNISLRQHMSVSLWGLFFTVLVVFLFAAPVQALAVTVLPVSLIIGLFFSRMKRLKWVNLFVLLWLLLIFINHFLPLYYAS